MKVTMKEIAEIAGVHRSTVDKVLHNREGVSDEVRKKIQKIIDELDYRPNVLGRALQMQQNPIVIAAVLVKVDALDKIREGIEKASEEFKNFNVKIEYYIIKELSASEQVKTLEALVEKKVDGIIIIPINRSKTRDAINQAVDAGIPVITTNQDIENCRRLCFVGQGMERGAKVAGRLMKEFLRESGKIAVITNSNNLLSVKKREVVFKEFLKDKAQEIQIVETIETNDEPMTAFKKTYELLKEIPDLDGLYITCGCVRDIGYAVRLMEIQGKLRVISFEDYQDIIELMEDDTVTATLATDLNGQGYYSVKLLFEKIVYGNTPVKDFFETPLEIMVRENFY